MNGICGAHLPIGGYSVVGIRRTARAATYVWRTKTKTYDALAPSSRPHLRWSLPSSHLSWPTGRGGELYEPPAESAIGFGGRLQRREIGGLRIIGSCSNPPALATIPFAEND
jgi:hypothetical protein